MLNQEGPDQVDIKDVHGNYSAGSPAANGMVWNPAITTIAIVTAMVVHFMICSSVSAYVGAVPPYQFRCAVDSGDSKA